MANAKCGTELLERQFLALLRRRRELLPKVAENLVLHSRLAADEVLDALGQRNLLNLLLQLLSDDRHKNVGGFDRCVLDGRSGRHGSSRSSNGGDRSGRSGTSGGGVSGFICSSFCLRLVLKLIVDLLRVLGMAVDDPTVGNGVILGLELGLEGARGHARQRGRGADLDEPFKAVVVEKEVLGLDPPNRRSELVCEELNEDDVRELLPLLSRAPVVLVPLAEDLVEARRKGLVIDELGIFLGDFERLRDEIGDVFADQRIGVEVSGVDLLGQIYRVMSENALRSRDYVEDLQARNGMTPAQR